MKTVVTIRQVAEEARVSIQTVSRVINNRYDVAAETRQRVQEAVDRLGFKPNAIARGLASRRSRTLGLVAYDFSDYFFSQVIIGAEQEAQKHDYVLMLGSSHSDVEDEPKYLRLLSERHVEGVLFGRQSSAFPELDHLVTMNRSGVPIVLMGFHASGIDLSAVDVDNVSGSRAAAECLLQHGHREIATITGPLTALYVIHRLQGFREGLEAAGCCLDPDLVVEGGYSHSAGYQAATQLLTQGKRFSAIFAHNDRLALGAMMALREAGYRVPEDISIIGYDDMPEAEFMNPPLTTVYQPMLELGVEAVRLLVRLIENPIAASEQIMLSTKIIWRCSVASK